MGSAGAYILAYIIRFKWDRNVKKVFMCKQNNNLIGIQGNFCFMFPLKTW